MNVLFCFKVKFAKISVYDIIGQRYLNNLNINFFVLILW